MESNNLQHISKDVKKYWPDAILLPVSRSVFELGESMDFWGGEGISVDNVKKYADSGEVVFSPHNAGQWYSSEWHERRIAYFVAQIKASEMNPIAVFFHESEQGNPFFEVSDGLHRLAACFICEISVIPAVLLDDSFDSKWICDQIVNSEMLNSDELQSYLEASKEWDAL